MHIENSPFLREDKASMRLYAKEVEKTYTEKNREAAARYRAKMKKEERQAYDRAKYLRKKEQHREQSKQWTRDNPIQMQAAGIQHRVKRKYPEKYKAGDIKDREELVAWIQERKGLPCVYCKTNLADSVDHIVPISNVGTHTWDNLCMACSVCNKMKLDHYLADWLDHMRAILKNYPNELSP